MYPTISHLIYDLFGINIPLPIQTFGFWVAIAFLFASWIISLELKRKESEGLLFPIKTKIIFVVTTSPQTLLFANFYFSIIKIV